MDNYYQNSASILAIEKACDMAQVGYTKECDRNNGSRKRSRESFDSYEIDEVFREIYAQMKYNDVYPTFRSFVLSAFYILLSFNENNEYYNQTLLCVKEFRTIIAKADKFLFQSRLRDVYFTIVNELVLFLRRSQQLVLLFHLSCENTVRVDNN
jgi:hypothetical protein